MAADGARPVSVLVLDRRPLFGGTSARLSGLLAGAWHPDRVDIALEDVDRALSAGDRWYGGKDAAERRRILAEALDDLRAVWALVAYPDGETDEVPVLSYTVFGAPAGTIRIGRPPVAVPESLSGIRIGFPPEREEC